MKEPLEAGGEPREFPPDAVAPLAVVGGRAAAPLAGLWSETPPLEPETPAAAVRDLLGRRDGAPLLVVAGPDGKPAGVIDRGRFLLPMASRYGHALFMDKRAEQLMEADFLALPHDSEPAAAYLAAAARPEARRMDALVVTASGRYLAVLPMEKLMEAVAAEQRKAAEELERLRARESGLKEREIALRAALESGIGRLLATVERYAGGDLAPRPHAVEAGPLAALDAGVEEMRRRLADLIATVHIATHQAGLAAAGLAPLGEELLGGGDRQLAKVQDLLQTHQFLIETFRAACERSRGAANYATDGIAIAELGAARVESALEGRERLSEALRRTAELLGDTLAELETAGTQARILDDLLMRAGEPDLAQTPAAERLEGLLAQLEPAHRRGLACRRSLQAAIGVLSGVSDGLSRLLRDAAEGGQDIAAARRGLAGIVNLLRGAQQELGSLASGYESERALLETAAGAVGAVLDQAEENRRMALALRESGTGIAGDLDVLRGAVRRFTLD